MALIQKKAGKHGIPMGAHVVQPDPEQLNKQIVAGYQFVAYSVDSVFLYQAAERPVF